MRRFIACLGHFAFIYLALATAAIAQSPEFDVAAITPNHTADEGYSIRTPPGGRFTARNVTVKTLLLYALDLKDFQLAGLPRWCESEKYDINAKENLQKAIDPEALRPLIRKLLEARFQLAFHTETKVLPVYSLIMAKGGPRLSVNTGTPGHSSDWGSDHINATAVSVAEFGHLLETQLDRVVVDESGIQGIFDFHLKWASERNPDSPSLFTAIRESYGLTLKSTKASVAMTVIDHVEHPSEN